MCTSQLLACRGGLTSQSLADRALHVSISFSSVPSLRLIHSNLPQSTLSLRSKAEDAAERDDIRINRSKQTLFSRITEALDFSQARSSKDAELIEDARAVTRSGGQMNPEQYGALRRKIGGTYKDFFKDSVEVDGEYVDEGWVDKTCRFCKKDTSNDQRSVDRFGRYAHISCLEKANSRNFFTRLF